MHKKNLWSTFRGNNDFPVYNWFYFTEAYSRGIVREVILKNPVKSKDIVLYDPFCGTGTSLLVAKEFGYQAYGTDVSYLMYLVAKGKCLNYDLDKLEYLLPQVLETPKDIIKITKENEWMKKYFYAESLQCILHMKNNIDALKEKEKHFFYIVLLRTIEIVSKARKQGADLRVRKIEQIDALKKFERVFKLFFKEIKKFYSKNTCDKEPQILNESCLTFYKNNETKFDYIICSPPYLNKTEYTKRFGIELAILGKETILPHHLGALSSKQEKEKDWIYLKHFSKLLEKVKQEDYKHDNYDAHEYFKQLEIYVSESVAHLKKNGVFANVIAGGVFYNAIFDIYDYMQDLYLKNGLEIVDIKVNREITANRDRTDKIGSIKEFTIVGRKN